MDLATKKIEFLTPDTADVDEFDLSADGRTIAYVTNEKGAGVLHLFDIATRADRAVPGIPMGDRFRGPVAPGRGARRLHADLRALAPTTPTRSTSGRGSSSAGRPAKRED